MDGLVELIARAIYCDGSYRQYDPLGADPGRWAKTSEVQRRFCRDQARAAIDALHEAGYRIEAGRAGVGGP